MGSKSGRIGLAEVESLGPNAELWDAGKGAVPGFGVRRQRSEARSYVVLYRLPDGRSRRYTIGRHGAPWTPDTARKRARDVLAAVVKGEDPAEAKREERIAPTVGELCERYIAAAEAGRLTTRRGGTKKPSTLATDRSRIDAHVLPLLGKLTVRSITAADLERFMHDVADGKTHRREALGRPRAVRVVRGGIGTASRTIGLLGAIFAYAVKLGLRPDNPARGVLRPADGRRERRLAPAEYAALARGLEKAAQADAPRPDGKQARGPMWPHARAAIRFLALTGWRSGEALGLRWRDLDLARRTANLDDTKTGASMRPLSNAAMAVLKVQRASTGGAAEGLVFPPARGEAGATMTGFKRHMAKAVALAELPRDVTAHVLRHSFASVAGDLGYSEATIAALIGHRRGGTTNRYVHFADAPLLAAADRVAGEILRQMGEAGAEVVPLATKRRRAAT
jgi:integrase